MLLSAFSRIFTYPTDYSYKLQKCGSKLYLGILKQKDGTTPRPNLLNALRVPQKISGSHKWEISWLDLV
jgi:hypothetical protein